MAKKAASQTGQDISESTRIDDVTSKRTKRKAKKSTRKKSAAKKKGPKAKKTQKVRVWTFPKNPLEEAIKIPRAIDEKFGGNPAPASDLAKAVGFRQAQNWRFRDLLKSANQYGLVEGSGKTARVSLDRIGEDIVAPSSATQRQQALRNAFRNVEEFSRVEDYYRGKRLPDDEYFLNTLVREFGIDRDRVETFAEVFRENDEFLRSFDVDPSVLPDQEEPETTAGQSPTSQTLPRRVREFLDTCFVMMPFGDWFDRYYQDIYVPAIKDAGFEPRRADELFTTGSVVEQIWQQIDKGTQ